MKVKYGQKWPDSVSDLEIELICFRDGLTTELGGLGVYNHFRNATKLIFPKLDWHPWMTRRCKALCENHTVAWTGAGATGKTFDASLFGLIFWLAAPQQTSIIMCSTTGKMVRRRMWPNIQELYSMAGPNMIGNLVDSKTTLQATKGDDKHGIFALAVKDGPVATAVADIQGVHAPRMIVFLDEGTDVREAILEAIPNLRKGCTDFRFVINGNAASHLDPHGLCCEPTEGWSSINVETGEWETKGVPKWEIEPGICQHFDGMKSPNIMCGQDKWPFLFTNADLKRAMEQPGAAESISFWKYTRGFWPPEGVCRTIMSEGLVEKYHLREKFTFWTNSRMVAGLDPGFGGDRCLLRIGRLGDLADGRLAVQLDKKFVIPVKAQTKVNVYDQIVNQVVPILESNGVPPEAFGLDASGQGGVLAATFVREWSSNIQLVEFGREPSDQPTSADDNRPAKEIYDRRVTELWFTARDFAVNGQLRGLDAEEVRQFCSREFSDDKRKIKLDTKDDCRLKIGRSPDDADAVVVLLAVAKVLGALPWGGGAASNKNNWLEIARQKDDINIRDDEPEPVADEDPFALSDI